MASHGMPNDWDYFGISKDEYDWLFTCGVGYLRDGEDDDDCIRFLPTNWDNGARRLRDVSQAEAISRLRKFIAYKRRKHDLIHDEKYGVSDVSRRAEGNQMFALLAIADALAAAV